MDSEADWKTVRTNERTVDWRIVLQLNEQTYLGMDRGGRWLVGSRSDVIPLELNGASIRVLPILELPPNETVARLKNGVKVDHALLSAEGTWQAPPQLAIEAALIGRSDYWAALAMSWLEVVQPTASIVELLQQVRRAPWASQDVRHKANAWLARQHY